MAAESTFHSLCRKEAEAWETVQDEGKVGCSLQGAYKPSEWQKP